MKKNTLIVLVAVVVAILLGFSWVKSNYNSMVVASENVSAQWSNVENQYQRRADLIPNLVNVVKGYAEHESATLTEVVEARAKATQVQLNFDNVNDQTLASFSQAQGELSSALSRLMAISEAYPDLKANENFRDLQTQLEGTENRIAVERRNFNEAARAYNTTIQMFPRNMLAGMFGFSTKAYFSANEGSDAAPVVNF